MATPVTQTVTAVITKTLAVASTTASSTGRATPQGGILEGANPAVYDAKNPLTLFIIQASICAPQGKKSLTACIGWYNHHDLPTTTHPTVENQATMSHS
jgi:hypothetical protein